MKEKTVSAFIQGHLHTMAHAQQNGFLEDSDIHYFTIGAGALASYGNGDSCNEVKKLKKNKIFGIFFILNFRKKKF